MPIQNPTPPPQRPGNPQQQPPGANVATGPGSRPPGPPQGGGSKPSESDEGATPPAKPPMSGEGASGQRLPAPGEGPAKLTKPGEPSSDKDRVVSRTEKGDMAQGKGDLKIRLQQLDGSVVDHTLKIDAEPKEQFPFRIAVGGVNYERKRRDDEGREVYGVDPY